jgi:hypothetical protein
MKSNAVVVRKDGRTVAVLIFGKPPRFVHNDEGEAVRTSLAARRFVRNPHTQEMAVFPDDARFKLEREWWMAHLRDALWPGYTFGIRAAKEE